MKAPLVNRSPHENGNTATALAEVARTLEPEIPTVTEYQLSQTIA